MSLKRMERSVPPATLENLVAKQWQLDFEPFEPYVSSCFGQQVPLINLDGTWTERLDIEHIGYGVNKLNWVERFHVNPLVEWIYRSCVVERIQTHIDVRPMFGLAPYLQTLRLPPGEKDIAPAFLEWVSAIIVSESAARRPHIIAGAKAIFQWSVEGLLPGFVEADLDTLSPRYGRKKYSSAVTLLDGEQGPFTASELVRIELSLHSNPEWLKERALYYLCRDWGLRPIQLALLRVIDLGTDAGGPYIRVPSVKGIRRSRLRRSPNNLRKRYLSDEAAEAIHAYVAGNSAELKQIQLKAANDIGVPLAEVEGLPVPIFPGSRSATRNQRFYADPALRPYTLHSDSNRLSGELKGWGDKLRVPSRYQDGEGGGQALEFSVYRFRRTKATSMVMGGHSPEDVAEALDHRTTGTVQHYFQFNPDLIDFVNAAHNTSAEIKEAVAFWSGRITSNSSPSEPSAMRVANLGICKAKEVCPHHPTVTCYSCPKFRPFKEADHTVAQGVIESLRERLVEQATGPVRRQVDSALAGVRAVIEAIAHDAK